MARLNYALLLLGGSAFAVSCAISGSTIDPSLDVRTSGGAAGKVDSAAGHGNGGASGKGQATAGDSGSNDTAGTTSSGGTGGSADEAGNGPGTGGAAQPVGGNGGVAGAATTAGSGGTAGAAAGGAGTGGASGEVQCPPNVNGHCEAGVTYQGYTGYTLNLVEDFPVALNLDTDPIFTWSDGIALDSQTAFRKDNITFSGGKMIITASNDCPVGTPKCIAPHSSYAVSTSTSPGNEASVPAMSVWSGELRSKYNNYRYGRYEMKAKGPVANPGFETVDAQAGNYLFNLFVYRTPRNVTWNEVDFGLRAYQHAKVAGGIPNSTSNVLNYTGGNSWSAAGPGVYQVTDEHVYAFTWTSTSVDWYVDGNNVQSYAYQGAQPTIPALSGKIMLNLWVFGDASAFGDPANNKYPFHGEIDYFHFYSWDADGTYPCKPAPACLATADKLASAQNNPNEVNYGQ